MKIQDVKNGDLITLRKVEKPKDNQVYIKIGYDRSKQKYELVRYDDINEFKYIRKNTEVYTDFIF